jgi:hypothetical protein
MAWGASLLHLKPQMRAWMSVYRIQRVASGTRRLMRDLVQIPQSQPKKVEDPYSITASLSLLVGLGVLVSLVH